MSGAAAKRSIAISLPMTGEEEWQAVREPLMSGWLTQGPKVAAFEQAFAQRHEVAHALAVTSCTTGLHLALAGLGIGPGDEVIVPSFTWVATANAILYCGGTPVLVDVDRETFNIDIAQVASKVTPRTRAVIAVHLFGLCADIDALRAALPASVAIVEDAACAAGASWNGRPAGSLGEVGVFSFHPRKSVTTGEGGMVTTNDPELAERMNQMRNHGASISEEQRHHGPRPWILADFDLLGYNYRMTDLQGLWARSNSPSWTVSSTSVPAGRSSIENSWVIWKWLRLPAEPAGARHGWQSFVTWVDPAHAPMPRNDMMQRLQEQGIATRPGTHAVHMLGYYREQYGYRPEDFPAARDCNDCTMAIPLHNRMTEDDYRYVVAAIRAFGG